MTCPCAVNIEDTVSLESLLRHVMPVIPKLPHSMALDMLRQAYIEFARRTGLLVVELTQDYQASVVDYYLEPPANYEVYSIIGLKADWFSYVDYWYFKSPMRWFNVIDNTHIELRSAPSRDIEDGLTIYVNVLPSECIDVIPKSIATPYGRGITQKVLSDAFCLPNKEWTSAELSRKHEMEFNRICLSGKQLSISNRKNGPLRARAERIL